MFSGISLLVLAMFSGAYIAPALTASFPAVMMRALAADCDRNYTVQSGDTCNTICALQSVSTYQLEFVNNGTIDATCDNLQAGEVLCLGTTGEDCDVVHVIQEGDGCDTISAAAGIPQSTLMTNNPNINAGCTNIYPGEVLCTSAQIYTYGNSTGSA